MPNWTLPLLSIIKKALTARGQKIARMVLSVVIMGLFLLHVAGNLELPFLDQLENSIYDMRTRLTMPGGVDPRVVIVDIDEESLMTEGRWPWGRDKVADLVDKLFDNYRIAVLGFDILFAEEDNSSGIDVLEKFSNDLLRDDIRFQTAYQRYKPFLHRDMIFAHSLEHRPVVLGYYFKGIEHIGLGVNRGVLPPPLLSIAGSELEKVPFANAVGYGATLGLLQKNAYGSGFIDKPLVDADGVIRRILMVQEFNNKLYESFALAIVRALLGNPPVEFHVAEGYEGAPVNKGLEWLQLEGFNIPVDETGAVLVPYRGRFGSFPYVSATDVLSGRADKKLLDGAIVLVGTSAAGLLDLRSTPVQNVYPGVEIHANVISGILDNSIKQRPAYVMGVEFIAIIVIGLVLSATLSRLPPLWTIPVTLGIILVLVGINIHFWNRNIVLPLATPILFVVVYFVNHVSFGFFVEQKDKRRLAAFFRFYVPPELVREMVDRQEDFDLEGESRDMTVMFCDIRGFTSISETMPPKQLSRMINAYLTHMTEVIHHHRGTIDKFIGDAIMSFWGAPLPDLDHPRNAVSSALEMVDKLPAMNDYFKKMGWPQIRIGIGVNSGMMNVGNMGSEYRMSYTVLGDAVNLASRLERLTKEYGVPIIVSQATHDVTLDFVYRDLDRVRVLGKDEPVGIYEPLGRRDMLDASVLAELRYYFDALTLYRRQQWLEADEAFHYLCDKDPHNRLYRVYLERVRYFVSRPPGDLWDGVYTQTSK